MLSHYHNALNTEKRWNTSENCENCASTLKILTNSITLHMCFVDLLIPVSSDDLTNTHACANSSGLPRSSPM